MEETTFTLTIHTIYYGGVSQVISIIFLTASFSMYVRK